MMQINARGLDIIKESEGLSLTAYKCPAGIWTIGYGHTGRDVHEGMTISQLEADMLLLRDLCDAESTVSRLVLAQLNSNQFSALVSFTYNVGAAALHSSTLLKKLNQGDYAGASSEFPRWNKADGKVLPGLVKRRQAERELFESPMPSSDRTEEIV